jgi:8-oxo-dGTP diphosphatase
MRLRESVRALVLDELDHVLLVRFHWEGLEHSDGFWANPGGGVEAGETRLAALRRELREETGLEVDLLGPEVWTKTAVFSMTDWDGQVDHIHLVRCAHFEPQPLLTAKQLAAEHVHELRWWSPSELAASDAVFAPRELPTLLGHLLARGIPGTPVRLTGF